jgi:hypothetical protein
MNLPAYSHRSDRSFQVGEMVLLKLHPYAQSTVANRPCPKLAMKFFGPYKALENVGTTTYKFELVNNCQVYLVFYVPQLKPFSADYSLDF